jgi:phosphate:Na+ symporter
MDFFSIIKMLGGLAFFLYGMTMLSGGLERLAGGKLEEGLKKLTTNRFMGLFLGLGITTAIQSSSAVTVMLVGLVNSGIMTIGRSIPVIMGSNIGTTMTAWILTLVGVESDNLFMKLLKPENFSLIFAFIGFRKHALLALGLLFFIGCDTCVGISLIDGYLPIAADSPVYRVLYPGFDMVWALYLPAQILLSLSLLPKRFKRLLKS